MNKTANTHPGGGAGFTLVEILVSIAVLAIMGALILNVFSRSLRGGNKARIVLAIKQNGQALLESMDKTIRNSDNVVCPAASGDTIVVVKDGTYTRYRFTGAAADANGFLQQDNPQPINDDIVLFVQTVCTTGLMDDDAKILTDTKRDTGVSVVHAKDEVGIDLPVFTRDKSSGFKDAVTIRFQLQQGAGVTSGTAGTVDPVEFKTTIQLR